ncbi:MAG TPA: phytanoyl-CoA dioxygenase family protein [Alphaproteobacteria bacterium]|nr:phytanoyl-CoA dioxygenase family protein [Alphaproteobacteria bacterium]
MLTRDQIEEYFERGFTIAEGVLDGAILDGVRAIIDGIVENARSVTRNNEVYDLEESHTPAKPRVRRIKEPVDRHPLFWELLRSDGIIGPVKQLIGQNLRLHGSKLNMKSAGYGAPVEWHQDWAFYPHTNEDILAIGVMLDDVTLQNGPLQIIPGSHRGPIYNHQNDGFFVGAIDVAGSGLDVGKAEALTGTAGSMTIHHVRAIHGSALNLSGQPRRMLFYEIAAADAWPLATYLPNYSDFEHFFSKRMITGIQTLEPRVVPVPIRMPGALRRSSESIYNLQLASKRYFNPFQEAG